MKNNLFLAVIMMNVAFTAINAEQQVFLSNNYGAELAYSLNGGPENRLLATDKKKLLGEFDTIKSLDIRTTGFGSSWLSPYTSLINDVKKIRNDSHFGKLDAVVVIHSSDVASDWKVSINWVPTAKTIQVFDQNPELRLKMMVTGYLGDFMENFITTICKARYAEGKQNLCERLKSEIQNIRYEELNQYCNMLMRQYQSMKAAGLIQ